VRDTRRKITEEMRRVVVKVGSSVVARARGEGSRIFTALAADINALRARGGDAIVVSSGAVALGMERLGLGQRPSSIPEFQAVAAAGQGGLVAMYDGSFAAHGVKTAQVLLTHADLASRTRFLNARNTLTTLLRLGVVPVINENDTVAVEELKFGDNDTLAALVTNLVEADMLVMLTDTDGLFDRDPKKDPSARLIECVEDVDSLGLDWVEASRAGLGSGGMRSKCDAARKAAHFGIPTIIASGLTPGILGKVFAGEAAGTLFLPKEDRLTSRKHWIAFSTRPTGRVFVDPGGREALVSGGKSLLPSGIKDVDGSFEAGEVVHCVDLDGMEFARGMTNYSSAELAVIKGLRSADIEGALGYKVYDEAIHRDNLVIM